jgi:hypothetical protein
MVGIGLFMLGDAADKGYIGEKGFAEYLKHSKDINFAKFASRDAYLAWKASQQASKDAVAGVKVIKELSTGKGGAELAAGAGAAAYQAYKERIIAAEQAANAEKEMQAAKAMQETSNVAKTGKLAKFGKSTLGPLGVTLQSLDIPDRMNENLADEFAKNPYYNPNWTDVAKAAGQSAVAGLTGGVLGMSGYDELRGKNQYNLTPSAQTWERWSDKLFYGGANQPREKADENMTTY